MPGSSAVVSQVHFTHGPKEKKPLCPHKLSDETRLALHHCTVTEHPIQSAYTPAEVYALTEFLKSSPWLGEKQMSFNVHENESVSHFTAECNRIHCPTNKVLKYLI